MRTYREGEAYQHRNPQDGYCYQVLRMCDLGETANKCPPGESDEEMFWRSTHFYLFSAAKSTSDTLLTWDAMQERSVFLAGASHLDYSHLFYCTVFYNSGAFRESVYRDIVTPAMEFGIELGCVVMGEIRRNEADLLKTKRGYHWGSTRNEIAAQLRG